MKRIIGTLFIVVGIAFLIFLGSWQYGRNNERLAFEEIRDARAALPPVTLDRTINASEDHMRQFNVAGSWGTQRHIVKHRIRDGKPGFWLVVPFTTKFETVLVRVGWFPFEQKVQGGALIALPTGTLHGMVYTPSRVITDPDNFTEGDLKVWSTFDIEGIAGTNARRETVLWLHDKHSTPPFPITSLKDISQPFLTSEKHLGYAFTWYGLAVALFGLWAGTEWRRRKAKRRSQR